GQPRPYEDEDTAYRTRKDRSRRERSRATCQRPSRAATAGRTSEPDRYAMSASTIIATNSAKETVGFHPSRRSALLASPIRWSTSAGRNNAGSVRTYFSQSK